MGPWLYFLIVHAKKAHDFENVFPATFLFPWLLKKILCGIDLAGTGQVNSWEKVMKNMYTFNCHVHSCAHPLMLILALVEIFATNYCHKGMLRERNIIQFSYLIQDVKLHLFSLPKVTHYLHYFFSNKTTYKNPLYIKCMMKIKRNSSKCNCHSLPTSKA